MHVPRLAEVVATAGGVTILVDPGKGSAPDVEARLRPAAAPTDGPWRVAFATWPEALAYIVPQDRALSSQPWRRQVTSQEIDLGIPIAACRPLEGEVRSGSARAIVGDAEPFCFLVPAVDFLFARQDRLPL